MIKYIKAFYGAVKIWVSYLTYIGVTVIMSILISKYIRKEERKN